MEDFRVELCNQEEMFKMRYGVNKGFTQITSKISRCLFISSGAKQLYTNLLHYAWDDSHECFPSQATLRFELRWSRQTLLKYLEELDTKGFIEIVEGSANQKNTYKFIELQKIPLIIHSELIYSMKPKLSEDIDLFSRRVEQYIGSGLFSEVEASGNPQEFESSIKSWFAGEEAVPAKTDKPTQSRTGLPAKSISLEVDRVADVDKVPKRAKKIADLTDPVEVWNCNYFLKYFEELYLKKHKTPYIVNEKVDKASLKRVIEKRESNELLKKMMEIYFEHSEEFDRNWVSSFCGTHVQNSIVNYLTYGKFNSYKKDKEEEIIDIPIDDGDEDEDSLDAILRRKGF